MSGIPSGGLGSWQKVTIVAGVFSTTLTGATALVSALLWIYGELNGIRGMVYRAQAEIAESRATVGQVAKAVDRIDQKIDRLLLPPPPKTP